MLRGLGSAGQRRGAARYSGGGGAGAGLGALGSGAAAAARLRRPLAAEEGAAPPPPCRGLGSAGRSRPVPPAESSSGARLEILII